MLAPASDTDISRRGASLRKYSLGKDSALDAFSQVLDVKIVQQAELDARHPQVGVQLELVCAEKLVGRLDFDHDLLVDEDVDAKGRIQRTTLVAHRDGHLAQVGQACLLELAAERLLIHSFQQAGPSAVCTRMAHPMIACDSSE